MTNTYRIILEVTAPEGLDSEAVRLAVGDALRDQFSMESIMFHGDPNGIPMERLTIDGRTYRLEEGTLDSLPEYITPEVAALIKENKTIQAIKLVREISHLSLGEAKAVVDNYRADVGLATVWGGR